MSRLEVTLIDVGWGDSIFLETWDDGGEHLFALIDSNDTATLRSSYIFLRRFFERSHATRNTPRFDRGKSIVFDWVLLTHAHADHAQGLKNIVREFGTRRLWFPNTGKFRSKKDSASSPPPRPAYLGSLARLANRSARVRHWERIDNTTPLPNFGQVQMTVLWPPPNYASQDENNNSVVLSLTLGNRSFVLTGDAGAELWKGSSAASEALRSAPGNASFFKVPHHGAINGMFVPGSNETPWVEKLSPATILGISSHVQPFSHPRPEVIGRIQNQGLTNCYRTDQHFHVTVWTDSTGQVGVRYSH